MQEYLRELDESSDDESDAEDEEPTQMQNEGISPSVDRSSREIEDDEDEDEKEDTRMEDDDDEGDEDEGVSSKGMKIADVQSEIDSTTEVFFLFAKKYY